MVGSTPLEMDRTSLWKGARRSTIEVDFWYFLISLRATVPGLNLLFCLSVLTPPSAGAVFFLIPYLEAFDPVALLFLRLVFFFPTFLTLGMVLLSRLVKFELY